MGQAKQHVQEKTLSLLPAAKKTTRKLSGSDRYLAHAAKIPNTQLKCAPSREGRSSHRLPWVGLEPRQEQSLQAWKGGCRQATDLGSTSKITFEMQCITVEKWTHVPGEKPEKTQRQKQKSSRTRLILENQRKYADPEALHRYGWRKHLNHEVWKATLASFYMLQWALASSPGRSNSFQRE